MLLLLEKGLLDEGSVGKSLRRIAIVKDLISTNSLGLLLLLRFSDHQGLVLEPGGALKLASQVGLHWCLSLRQERRDALIVVLKLLSCNVDVPVDDLHEVSFEVVDVRQGDAANLCDVAVCVISIVVNL